MKRNSITMDILTIMVIVLMVFAFRSCIEVTSASTPKTLHDCPYCKCQKSKLSHHMPIVVPGGGVFLMPRYRKVDPVKDAEEINRRERKKIRLKNTYRYYNRKLTTLIFGRKKK